MWQECRAARSAARLEDSLVGLFSCRSRSQDTWASQISHFGATSQFQVPARSHALETSSLPTRARHTRSPTSSDHSLRDSDTIASRVNHLSIHFPRVRVSARLRMQIKRKFDFWASGNRLADSHTSPSTFQCPYSMHLRYPDSRAPRRAACTLWDHPTVRAWRGGTRAAERRRRVAPCSARTMLLHAQIPFNSHSHSQEVRGAAHGGKSNLIFGLPPIARAAHAKFKTDIFSIRPPLAKTHTTHRSVRRPESRPRGDAALLHRTSPLPPVSGGPRGAAARFKRAACTRRGLPCTVYVCTSPERLCDHAKMTGLNCAMWQRYAQIRGAHLNAGFALGGFLPMRG